MTIPRKIRQAVKAALNEHYPAFDHKQFAPLLRLLWLNNENYVRISPPKRVAQVLWMYHLSNLHGGIAHTQHLKNKDIFEGGSKMVVLLDAVDLKNRELLNRRLYKLPFGFINAFFDIFVTENGQPKDPRVVDYYGEDEAIEIGPDENMHDSMVELIARQSVRRGYLLGNGVISSKKAGINHKEFGVTSTGVIKFAEITMEQLGIDVHCDAFSVKFTGGPGGDVAGNAMRLLLERCPAVRINLILDGTGALPTTQDSSSFSGTIPNSVRIL